MKTADNDNEELSFQTLAAATANVLRYLSTQKNDGRSDVRPEDQRKREDAEEKKGDASRSKFSNVMVGPNAA